MKYINLKAIIVILCVGLCGSSLSAQTSRRKPKPLATPPPVLTGAEIISQAGSEIEPTPTPEERPVKPATTNAERIKQLNDRVKKLEGGQSYEDRQKRLLMNLDILTRLGAEGGVSEKAALRDDRKGEHSHRASRSDRIRHPAGVDRTVAQLAGSLRPEEIRENRRKSLAAERTNLQALLTQVQSTRSGLEASLQRAEQMVEKLRGRAEKDIDDSLQEKVDEPEN